MTLSEIFSAIYAERESPSYAVQWDDMHKRTSIFNIRVARGQNLRESTESGREHPSQAYSTGNEKAHSNSAEYKNGHDSMMNMLVKTQATTTVYDVNGPENRNRFPRTDCAAILKFMLRYFRPTVVLTGTPSAAASGRARSITALIPRTLT